MASAVNGQARDPASSTDPNRYVGNVSSAATADTLYADHSAPAITLSP